MYPFVSHTWNPIKGKCPHDCSYCYMKIFPQRELHLDEKGLAENLGVNNFIFVGSSTDMWADIIHEVWISKVLAHCAEYPDNRYLFQSKNPARFLKFNFDFPALIFGTTIETDRHYVDIMGKAYSTYTRYQIMTGINLPKMVSIEPIMDFDLDTLVRWIARIKPEFVSIGADSKGHRLPEPPATKIQCLIGELQDITQVKIKDNLKRLLNE